MFRNQVGVLAQPVAGPFDLDHDSVVEQTIEQRSGDHGAAENLPPLSEATVGGQDHRAALVACVDQLEEQVAAARDDRLVADLVDDKQGKPAVEADFLSQRPLPLGAREGIDKIGQGNEVDAASGLHRLDAERDPEVRLAGAGRTRAILPNIMTSMGGSSIDITLATVRAWRS
jgi:hypothetical protein